MVHLFPGFSQWSHSTLEMFVVINPESYPLQAPRCLLMWILHTSLSIAGCGLCAEHCALHFVFTAALQVVRLEQGINLSRRSALYIFNVLCDAFVSFLWLFCLPNLDHHCVGCLFFSKVKGCCFPR